jgi:hypothetical protein
MATNQEAVVKPARVKKWWLTDTRTIMMLLMFGVAMNAIQQVTERLDTALTGGTGFFIGHITYTTLIQTAAIFFGPMAFVVGVLSNLLSALTSTSPGAWYWVFDNLWIGTVVGWFAFLINVRGDLTRRSVILAAFVALIVTPIDYAGLYLILLKLPLGAALVASLPYVGLTFLTIPLVIGLVKAIEAAKFGI